jgi:hypothetical protein
MHSQQFVDPQRMEIKPPAWRVFGLVLGIIIFSVVGAIIAVVSESLVDRLMGIVAVVFFGVGGAVWVFKSLRQEHLRVAVTPSAFEIYLVGVGWRRIPWGDIEEFGAVKHGKSEFTAVRLRNYGSLLSGISPEQSKAMMRWLPAARLALHGLANLVAASGDDESAEDLAGMSVDLSHVRNLEDALRLSRNNYGGEFLLPWSARDRSAKAFAKFLDDYGRSLSSP